MSFLEQWGQNSFEDNIESAFDELHAKAVRHTIFVWNEWNALASGTGSPEAPGERGLTNFGEQAVKKANDLNWVLDASHFDEPSFWNIHDISTQPIIASHSNAFALCPQERNLTDEQLKAIAVRGGLIGLNAFSGFVAKSNPTLDRFIDHAVYIANLVGPQHLAFGFDFLDYLSPQDLGEPFSSSTKGLENVTKVPDLLERMTVRGFSTKELEGISFNNAFDYMEKMLK